jgi:3-(3-hydroxy-phenyl)propionate hydroxylase
MGDVSYISHPTEWCALVHAPQLWRVLFPVQAEIGHEDSMAEDYLQQRIKRIAAYGGDYSIAHRTIYSVNQRVAETYRRDRVLLAGDAAHVNNPLGGMGMNGGIHDGINVAEKLVAVLNEGESEDLLDKYDRQRRPIAIDYVQAQTIRNKQMIEEADPAVRRRRQDELRAVADDRQQSIEMLLQTSMINAVRKSQSIE